MKRVSKALAVIAAIVALVATEVYLQRNPNPLPEDARADKVLIEKSARRLSLMRNGELLKSYKVALGRSPEGQKEKEGDKRTPEGKYVIDLHNARSGFHKALHISYPTADQRAKAAKVGVDPGGDILIHGLRNRLGWIGAAHRVRDWTAGCVAVTNPEIDEIYRAVADGTSVEIVP
jgi:murein L,D-transpeptidase YafK